MTNLVNRTLYRALLRATHNGQRPEILSLFGSVHAYINSGISSNLPAHPNSPDLVRQHLQFTFRYPTPNQAEDIDDDTNELYDGFAALRCANENTKVLYPRLEHTAPLGIFDFSSTFLLPNEEFSFNFFEPRYKTMALDAIEHHDGWFILRGAAPTEFDDGMEMASVLCRIKDHVETPEGQNVFTQVIAGPRVQVIEEMEEDRSDHSVPLTLSSEFEWVHDTLDAFDTTENIRALMEDVMQQLIHITVLSEHLIRSQKEDQPRRPAAKEDQTEMKGTGSDEVENVQGTVGGFDIPEMDSSLVEFWERQAIQRITQRGLPPLDPEYFSFWALKLVSGHNTRPEGVQQRLSWLACRSTAYRLRHCLDVLKKQQSNTLAQVKFLHENAMAEAGSEPTPTPTPT